MKNHISRREALRYLTLVSAAAIAACQPNRSTQEAGPLADTPPHPDETGGTAGNLLLTDSPPASLSTDSASADGEEGNKTTATSPSADQVYLSVAHGEDPATITEAAMRALGGMERFVKNGHDVIIKPNICTDTYPFEYGATTNPIVVGTLVRLALGAGAKRVRVMDFPFGGTPESAYAKSGIADAVKAAGGEMEIMNMNKFRLMSVPNYQSLYKTAAYQDALDCDLLINVPITKHHTMARITVGCKNLLGLILDRGAIHSDFKRRIPDLVNLFRPGLTVVDAIRTLMANGPTGGNLDDVVINNTVIASHDVVAADSYATRFFGLTGADIPYIAFAAEQGLGKMDLSGLKIEEINV